MNIIELKAQEYGMRVFEVIEYNTSRICAYHDVEVTRDPRGVVNCPNGHKLHSDLNGALNILKRATGIVISAIKKPLSFIVDHNRVAPLMGRNPLDLGEPPPNGGEEVRFLLLLDEVNYFWSICFGKIINPCC